MATMYPAVFPRPNNPEDPEFIVYQCLRKLPDPYVVFYSKRFTGGLFGKPECEIDFIVSNQFDVIVCLEVKGGVLKYDGAQDRWSQNGKEMAKGPDIQATGATHCLLRQLADELRNVSVDWAVCFPQCSVDVNLPPTNLPLSKIIDERRLLNIVPEMADLVQEIRSTYRRKGMTSREAQNVVERLTRSIGFVQALGVRIAREADQFIQVTEEQCEVLCDLEVNSRMIVHGFAGTGKTVLAQEFAKRLAAQGQSVLLLFYNKAIAGKVRMAFDRESTVTVSTFSSFARRLIDVAAPDWWETQVSKNDDFWHVTLPAKLLDIPTHAQPSFDAIIVDEGQDFKPEWYEYLLTLLVPGPSAHFCVFLDEHQDIFKHWHNFPCIPAPARKMLSKNCRNTRAIVECLNKSYPTPMACFERSPTGAAVVEIRSQSAIEEQTQIVREIKHRFLSRICG